ncbi:MAG: L,D-transpeptidase family protein [Terriglobales bacterium]
MSADGGAAPSEWRVHTGAVARAEAPQKILHSLIASGRLDDLRWPDFSDYRSEVTKLYAGSHFAPVWLRDGKPTAQALEMIAVLQEADHEALRAEDYDSYRWLERLAYLQRPHSTSDEMRFDVALTVCTMRYVSDLRVGRISAPSFRVRFTDAGREQDLHLFVRLRLAEANDVGAELARIEPRFAAYGKLRDGLAKYTRLAAKDDGEQLPVPQGMGYPGPPYPGYARLVRLLRLVGDLPESYSTETGREQVYDATLMQAVRRFQKRHGLQATGYLDDATIRELNVPLSYRVEQIRLALERFRWMHYDFRRPAIVVNIPEFRLYAFDKDGKAALQMKVDVGDEFNGRTPEMDATLSSVVFRPYWYVPPHIASEEWVPFLATHRNFLASNDYEVWTSGGKRVSSEVTATSLAEMRAGRLRIRQRPGDHNPMGAVKFVLPNPHGVYLHDIPLRDVNFIVPERLVSHGCVHVEHPTELAAWVLRDQPGWSVKRVQAAMQGRGELAVKVAHPLPVLIVYATATASENGDIYFFRDIYGYDASLKEALARSYPAASSQNLK